MSARTVITHAPNLYVPSDGMTPCQFRRDSWGRSSCATVGTPTVAVHVLKESLPVAPAGTHLCAYHSPWDVRTAPVGVSLAKATDRPNGVAMVTSAGEEGYRARQRVDVARGLSAGLSRGLDRNESMALARVFGGQPV